MADLNLSPRAAIVAILWPRLYHSVPLQQVELQKEVTVKRLSSRHSQPPCTTRGPVKLFDRIVRRLHRPRVETSRSVKDKRINFFHPAHSLSPLVEFMTSHARASRSNHPAFAIFSRFLSGPSSLSNHRCSYFLFLTQRKRFRNISSDIRTIIHGDARKAKTFPTRITFARRR